MPYFVSIRYGILSITSTQRPQPERPPMRDDQQPDGLVEYVRCFGWPNPPAGGPRRPCGARAEGRATRGRPRPEAQPARARPQAGARCCAEPEGQGGASQPVTAALLLRLDQNHGLDLSKPNPNEAAGMVRLLMRLDSLEKSDWCCLQFVKRLLYLTVGYIRIQQN